MTQKKYLASVMRQFNVKILMKGTILMANVKSISKKVVAFLLMFLVLASAIVTVPVATSIEANAATDNASYNIQYGKFWGLRWSSKKNYTYTDVVTGHKDTFYTNQNIAYHMVQNASTKKKSTVWCIHPYNSIQSNTGYYNVENSKAAKKYWNKYKSTKGGALYKAAAYTIAFGKKLQTPTNSGTATGVSNNCNYFAVQLILWEYSMGIRNPSTFEVYKGKTDEILLKQTSCATQKDKTALVSAYNTLVKTLKTKDNMPISKKGLFKSIAEAKKAGTVIDLDDPVSGVYKGSISINNLKSYTYTASIVNNNGKKPAASKGFKVSLSGNKINVQTKANLETLQKKGTTYYVKLVRKYSMSASTKDLAYQWGSDSSQMLLGAAKASKPNHVAYIRLTYVAPKYASLSIRKSVTTNADDVDTDGLVGGWWFKTVDTSNNNKVKLLKTDDSGKAGPINNIQVVDTNGKSTPHKYTVTELGKKLAANANLNNYTDITSYNNVKYGIPKKWSNVGGSYNSTTTSKSVSVTVSAKKRYNVDWTNHYEKPMPLKIVKQTDDGGAVSGYYFLVFDKNSSAEKPALAKATIAGPTNAEGETSIDLDNPKHTTLGIVELGQLKQGASITKLKYTVDEVRNMISSPYGIAMPDVFEIPSRYKRITYETGGAGNYNVMGVVNAYPCDVRPSDIKAYSKTYYYENKVELSLTLTKRGADNNIGLEGAKYGVFRYVQGNEEDIDENYEPEDVEDYEEYLDELHDEDFSDEGDEADEDISDEDEFEITDLDPDEDPDVEEDTEDIDEEEVDEEENVTEEAAVLPDNLVAVLTTDKNGEATVSNLPEGEYYVQELVAPEGYMLDDTQYPVELSVDVENDTIKNGELNVYDPPAGSIAVTKKSDNPEYTENNPCFSLKGAKFIVTSLETDEKWTIETGKVLNAVTRESEDAGEDNENIAKIEGLKTGRYSVVESEASQGYALNVTVFNVEVTVEDYEQKLDVEETHMFDPINVYLNKKDGENVDKAQGAASLAGAKFHFTIFSEEDGQGDVICKFDAITQDIDGIATIELTPDTIIEDSWETPNGSSIETWFTEGGDFMAPLGSSIKVKEVEAPEGYLLDNSSITVVDAENDETYDVNPNEEDCIINLSTAITSDVFVYNVGVSDVIIKGGVRVEKQDAEFNGTDVMSDLSGTAFAIVNKNEGPVKVDDVEYEPGETIGEPLVVEYDEESDSYIAETPSDYLPYGTYEIKEVLTNDKYVLSDSEPREFKIEENGEIVSVDIDDNDLVFKNSPVRAGFEFKKVAEDTKKPMQTVWVLTNSETEERHVIATGEDGKFSTRAVKPSVNTNANDDLLDIIDEGKAVNISDIEYNSGLWFGKGVKGTYSDPDDSKDSLPAGTYTLREVRSDSNVNYQLVGEKDDEVEIYIDTDGHLSVYDDIEDLAITVLTTAKDEKTDNHVGFGAETVTINDTVEYDGLVKGRNYTVKGTLMNAETNTAVIVPDGDGFKYVQAEKDFTAESEAGTVDVSFELDGDVLKGVKTVVFEKIYETDTENLIATHEDITDKNQTVVYPIISTTALSDNKIHEVKASEDTTIVDTVKYENILTDVEYELKGTLIDVTTGDEALDSNGNEITAQGKFTPEEPNGAAKVEFKFDSTKFAGHKLVVFEEVYLDGKLVASHADMDDEDQSIYIPEIHTSAKFDATDNNEGVVAENAVITDTVYYSGLIAGNTYKISGVLVNKETSEPIVVDGKQVTASAEFTPSSSEGSYDIKFEFDASTLKGKTVVAFETLTRDEIELAVHADINDENQTIYFPEITTKATYGTKDYNEGLAKNPVIIKDTVSFKNLQPGQEYKLNGVVMDKASGLALGDVLNKSDAVDTNIESTGTKHVKVSLGEDEADLDDVSFDDEGDDENIDNVDDEDFDWDSVDWDDDEDGSDDINYEDGDDIEDNTDGEDSEYEDVEDNTNNTESDDEDYTDIDDGDEDVTEPTGEDIEDATDGGDVEDNTEIEDNTEDETEDYQDETEEYQDETEPVQTEPETSAENEDSQTKEDYKYTASISFTPEKANGEIVVEFIIDASVLNGKDIVLFERLMRNDIQLTEHEDINDEGQTVHFPDIETTLTDKNTSLHETLASETVKLVDTVKYENLTVGQEYVMRGVLMDKSTNKALKDANDKEITAETKFTPEEKNGTVEVVFEFNGINLAGKTIVAFESCERSGDEVAVHTDINDEDQTVTVPGIKTTAQSHETSAKSLEYGESVKIDDTVQYTNLTAGKEYTITGTLMDKATGEKYKGEKNDLTTVEYEFTPEETDGFVVVSFVVSTKPIRNKTFVAFETVHAGGADAPVVAEHTDINDADQTVYVSDIDTKAFASDKRSKTVDVRIDEIIRDKVEYKNLVPGEEYVMKGVVVDKNGKAVSKYSTVEFTPEKTSAVVEMQFKADTTKHQGKKLTVFEYLYDKASGKLLTPHTDLNDEDQQVTVVVKPPVQTGIENYATLIAIVVATLFAIAMVLAGIMIYRRNKYITGLKG